MKVLIADDSALMRREIRRILEKDPEIEVIATARDGQDAINKTKEYDPDVVALDINMPIMNGITALQIIMLECPRPVVMISSLTQTDALISYEALELGAVDFIAKPDGTISRSIHRVAEEIIFKIKSAGCANRNQLNKKRRTAVTQKIGKTKTSKIIVIGQSTGGPKTIMDILPVFPPDLPAPVLIIQHMPGSFTPSFASRLDSVSAIPFKEAQRGDIISPGHGFLAPGDHHLIVSPTTNKNEAIIRLSDYPTDTLYKPSVDITMKSILSLYGSNVIAVLLTGMGCDGADAMAEIRKAGGRTIAESEDSCVVFGMPKEAIKRGGAEFVLPSHEIGHKIMELLSCA